MPSAAAAPIADIHLGAADVETEAVARRAAKPTYCRGKAKAAMLKNAI